MSDTFGSITLNNLNSQSEQLRQLLTANRDFFGDLGDEISENIPSFVTAGIQSAAKSSINNRFIIDLGLSQSSLLHTSAGCATKMPTHIVFRHRAEVSFTAGIKSYESLEMIQVIQSSQELIDIMEKYTIDDLQNKYLEIIIESPKASNFTLIDLPGLIQSAPLDEKSQREIVYIEKLIRYYLQRPNTYVLHVLNLSQDLATIASINFIDSIVPRDKQIIVGSQIDRAVSRIGGVEKTLKDLINFYGTKQEIFIVQPANQNGPLNSSDEMANLKTIFNNHSQYKFGLGVQCLYQQIPIKLNKFVQTVQATLKPLLIKLADVCQKGLDIIGDEPKNSRTAIHEWQESLRNLSNSSFSTFRREINVIADNAQNTLVIDINQYAHDIEYLAAEALQEARLSRGEQMRGTESEDPAVKLAVKKLALSLNKAITDYNTENVKPCMKKLIHNIIDQLTKQHPTCVKATELLQSYWERIFNDIWNNYETDLYNELQIRTENPERSNPTDRICQGTLILIEMYQTHNQNGNQNQLINADAFKRFIKEVNPDVTHKLVLGMVKDFWKPFNTDFSTRIHSAISQMARDINKDFQGDFLLEIADKRDELVQETEKIQRMRSLYKQIFSIIQKLIIPS